MNYPKPVSIPGAAIFFDKIRPGWYKEINIDILDMQSHKHCILGQLYGSYLNGFNTLFNNYSITSAEDRVFGDCADLGEWLIQIKKRRNMHNFTWALEQLRLNKKVRRKSWDKNTYLLNYDTYSPIKYNNHKVPSLYDISLWIDTHDWEYYEEEILLKGGSRVKIDKIEYIVARYSENRYNLINLSDGNRWNSGTTDSLTLANLIGSENYQEQYGPVDIIKP